MMTNQPLLTPLLTTEEIANWLKVKPNTVRAMARAGRIPFIRFGRFLRFEADSVSRWLESAKGGQDGASDASPEANRNEQ